MKKKERCLEMRELVSKREKIEKKIEEMVCNNTKWKTTVWNGV
jgi:hypothetical protein